MAISEIEEKFKIDLSQISNNGKTVKKIWFYYKLKIWYMLLKLIFMQVVVQN